MIQTYRINWWCDCVVTLSRPVCLCRFRSVFCYLLLVLCCVGLVCIVRFTTESSVHSLCFAFSRLFLWISRVLWIVVQLSNFKSQSGIWIISLFFLNRIFDPFLFHLTCRRRRRRIFFCFFVRYVLLFVFYCCYRLFVIYFVHLTLSIFGFVELCDQIQSWNIIIQLPFIHYSV